MRGSTIQNFASSTHQVRRALGDLRGHFHLGVVLGKLHRRHLADVHVLVLDEGLAGLDAFGGLEHDGDGRAFGHDALDRDPDGHHRGKDRDDPGIRLRFGGTTAACGRLSMSVLSATSTLLQLNGIPDQGRVEGLGRKHRQDHHRREKQHPRTELHRHQWL
jgi:hypothetical protein